MKTFFTTVLCLFFANALNAQTLDERHLLLDGSLSDAEIAGQPYVFNDFKKAASHFTDTTTLYIKPWVYWVDNPDDPEIVVGKDGKEPFGIVISAKKLDFIGLCENASDIVLASQRGQTQGAIGNFTMFDFHVDELHVENMTLGNFCNVDLDYPLNQNLSKKKRSDVITQAHVGYVHGNRLTAKNVRFISRLNLNPLNGAQKSIYEDCHFECTDDALNGNAVYRHCDFELYGAKPFWSTYDRGPLFIDCDFYVRSNNREVYFCKQGGPVTIVNSRYHAPSDSIYIGWTAYPQKWLRCYESNFTLNGKPYTIGARQPQNTIEMDEARAASLTTAPYLAINRKEAILRTGKENILLKCKGENHVNWRVTEGYESYVSLLPRGDSAVVVVPKNKTDETAVFCIMANTEDGREAACCVAVRPSQLPPPTFTAHPRIQLKKQATLQYALSVKAESDDSHIIWYRDSVPVATSHIAPETTYQIQEADKGHVLKAVIAPKQKRSNYGKAVECSVMVKKTVHQQTLETDFRQFYCDWQPVISEGLWTVDGYKPADTAEFPWEYDPFKPMWEYGEGYNGAVGMGLLQAQKGARLMYTPVKRTYNKMSLQLQVDPTKTAGQGFGSATGQYMDVCLKFDTETLTGYGLRIIRTTKHAKAVDFLLVEYKNGIVTPLTEPISSTCYRTGCTISIDFTDNLLTAHVETTTPQPEGSTLPHTVDLKANVDTNPFGGIHIQHTGSCGESTTMLHRLKVNW